MIKREQTVASNREQILAMARGCQIDEKEILYRGLFCGAENQFSVEGLLNYFEFDLLALASFRSHVEKSRNRREFQAGFSEFVKEMIMANKLK